MAKKKSGYTPKTSSRRKPRWTNNVDFRGAGRLKRAGLYFCMRPPQLRALVGTLGEGRQKEALVRVVGGWDESPYDTRCSRCVEMGRSCCRAIDGREGVEDWGGCGDCIWDGVPCMVSVGEEGEEVDIASIKGDLEATLIELMRPAAGTKGKRVKGVLSDEVLWRWMLRLEDELEGERKRQEAQSDLDSDDGEYTSAVRAKGRRDWLRRKLEINSYIPPDSPLALALAQEDRDPQPTNTLLTSLNPLTTFGSARSAIPATAGAASGSVVATPAASAGEVVGLRMGSSGGEEGDGEAELGVVSRRLVGQEEESDHGFEEVGVVAAAGAASEVKGHASFSDEDYFEGVEWRGYRFGGIPFGKRSSNIAIPLTKVTGSNRSSAPATPPSSHPRAELVESHPPKSSSPSEHNRLGPSPSPAPDPALLSPSAAPNTPLLVPFPLRSISPAPNPLLFVPSSSQTAQSVLADSDPREERVEAGQNEMKGRLAVKRQRKADKARAKEEKKDKKRKRREGKKMKREQERVGVISRKGPPTNAKNKDRDLFREIIPDSQEFAVPSLPDLTEAPKASKKGKTGVRDAQDKNQVATKQRSVKRNAGKGVEDDEAGRRASKRPRREVRVDDRPRAGEMSDGIFEYESSEGEEDEEIEEEDDGTHVGEKRRRPSPGARKARREAREREIMSQLEL